MINHSKAEYQTSDQDILKELHDLNVPCAGKQLLSASWKGDTFDNLF